MLLVVPANHRNAKHGEAEMTEKKSYLTMLAEVDLTEDVSEAFASSVEGEKEIGVLTENLQRAFHLMVLSIRPFLELKGRIDNEGRAHLLLHLESVDHGRDDCAQFHQDLDEKLEALASLGRTRETFSDLFWGMAKLEFPEIMSGEKIGVKQGYVLVSTPEEDDGLPTPEDLPEGLQITIIGLAGAEDPMMN